MRTDRSGVGSDITLLRPIVHLTEEELSFRGRKRKKRPEIEKRFSGALVQSPNRRESDFFYFILRNVAGIAGASLLPLQPPMSRGQGVRAPRTGAALIFRDEIVSSIPSSIPSSKRSSKRSSIPLPKFRSPNLRADFFIGVGVRALIALARYLTRCGALLARCGALLARCGALLARCGALTSSLRSAY